MTNKEIFCLAIRKQAIEVLSFNFNISEFNIVLKHFGLPEFNIFVDRNCVICFDRGEWFCTSQKIGINFAISNKDKHYITCNEFMLMARTLMNEDDSYSLKTVYDLMKAAKKRTDDYIGEYYKLPF